MYTELIISTTKNDIKYSTNIDELLFLKREINKMVDEQIKKIEDNQNLILCIRYNSYDGKFVVEKGIKAEHIILGFFNKREILEEVVCKRKGTKKFDTILNELKEKYNPDVLSI
jgi:hypothetical protein